MPRLQAWGPNDIGVTEEGFQSYEYRNAGMLEEPAGMLVEEAPKHKTIDELIKEHEGVRGIQFSTDEPVMYKPPISVVRTEA